MTKNNEHQASNLIDEPDMQSFNEQDFRAQETEGYESIQKDNESTGQDRDRMSKMGLKNANKSFHQSDE